MGGSGADPWLVPGLTDRERLAALLAEIQRRGWKLRASWFEELSWANPITRTIAIRHNLPDPATWAEISAKAIKAAIPLLAHELEHVRQWGPSWWRGFGRFLLYLLLPSTRLRLEIEGEGAEAAARWRVTGHLWPAHRLDVFGPPYWLPGVSKRDTDAEVLADAKARITRAAPA